MVLAQRAPLSASRHRLSGPFPLTWSRVYTEPRTGDTQKEVLLHALLSLCPFPILASGSVVSIFFSFVDNAVIRILLAIASFLSTSFVISTGPVPGNEPPGSKEMEFKALDADH